MAAESELVREIAIALVTLVLVRHQTLLHALDVFFQPRHVKDRHRAPEVAIKIVNNLLQIHCKVLYFHLLGGK